MNKAHSPINWQNKPSVNTPINETNLNKMDSTIGILDDRIIAHDTSKLDKSTANTMVKSISFDESTGVFTITLLNGSTTTIDTKLEKLAVNFSYDVETQQIVLELIDGTKQYIDLSALITQYEFTDSDTIGWEVTTDGKVKAKVLDGSITEDMLQPNYLADIKVETAKSESYMNSAKTSEINASSSANLAQSYAVGGTGTRDGEDTDNAKYYSENAKPVAQTITGTNPTATNSTNAPLIYGKIKGYTEQKTLSGKNLLKITNTTETTDGITFTVNEDGNITINGTATADVNFDVTHIANITGNGNIKRKLFQLNGSYTGTVEHLAFTSDWGNAFLVPIGEERFLNTDVTYSIFRIKVSSGTVCNNLKVGFMVAEDVSEYEPFCGGIASPNPDYPQDIKGLGDSGTIEVRTCGKNLISKNSFSSTQAQFLLRSYPIRLQANQTYVIQCEDVSVTTDNGIEFTFFDIDGNTNVSKIFIPSQLISDIPITFTPTEDIYSVSFWVNEILTIDGLQIHKGITRDTYEPYTETTATIPIDTLYGGDYLEVYADGSGKIVRESYSDVIREVNLDWSSVNPEIYADDSFYFQSSLSHRSNGIGLTNYLKIVADNTLWQNTTISGISFSRTGSFARLRLTGVGVSTQDEANTYLENNPLHVVYRLAEPIETPLTAEQVQAFKQLYTFDNVTNLLCDGELNARYYCNTDSGDTVGMIQETVDGLQKTVKEIPDTYTTQSDFDRIVGGTVRDSGLTNIEYTIPTEISSAGLGTQSNNSGTLVDALKKATSKITDFFSTLYDAVKVKYLGNIALNLTLPTADYDFNNFKGYDRYTLVFKGEDINHTGYIREVLTIHNVIPSSNYIEKVCLDITNKYEFEPFVSITQRSDTNTVLALMIFDLDGISKTVNNLSIDVYGEMD